MHRFAVVRRTRHRDVVVPFLDFCCRRVFLLAAVVFVGSSPLVNGSSPVSCVVVALYRRNTWVRICSKKIPPPWGGLSDVSTGPRRFERYTKNVQRTPKKGARKLGSHWKFEKKPRTREKKIPYKIQTAVLPSQMWRRQQATFFSSFFDEKRCNTRGFTPSQWHLKR